VARVALDVGVAGGVLFGWPYQRVIFLDAAMRGAARVSATYRLKKFLRDDSIS